MCVPNNLYMRCRKVPFYFWFFFLQKWQENKKKVAWCSNLSWGVRYLWLTLYKEIRDLFDIRLFVDTDADTRLARRVLRDIEEHGRDLENVLFQYTNLVKPAFEEFCLPTKKHADVIIPRGADNTVAVELVAQHIQDIIYKRKIASKNGSPFTRSRSNSCGEISR